ncbi:MAG: type IV pilus twitching motility protein PilT [Bradymonadales bacterium]|nr:type IV pilus twitching motility protein PilT [Bradymonadales bacterium]
MPFDLHKILRLGVKLGASDVHLKVGTPPTLRINGELKSVEDTPRLTAEELSQLASTLLSGPQRERFKRQLDIDLSYSVPGLGRFRVNIFLQRSTVGFVFRIIPFKVPSFESLLLPDMVKQICEQRRGLVLVTGATGSGKSTTLAAMIEHINSNRTTHIVTIEDPIEFLIHDKRSLVSQREIGTDSIDFHQSLRAALRQDPDVIMVGEMRDLDTIRTALHAAETGHLVLSTMHTTDATETVARVISAFPPHSQQDARLQLVSVLKAVVCQRLVTRKDGQGRVPAVEILISTGRIRELMSDEKRIRELSEAIAEGHDAYGMQTFDQSLMWLLQNNLVTYEEALLQASQRENFALRVSGVRATVDSGSWQYPALQSSAQPPGNQTPIDPDGKDFEIERF